nr:hypothetical protein [Nanoarchaeum sp.]
MVDSIGRLPIGRSPMMGRKRKNFLQKTIQKMEQWRDKARINLFQQRRRYKQKVERNQALMRAKKSGRLLNLNPSSKLGEVGFKPKSIHRYGLTHSTVSSKPRYSIVKPRERIYGNKWKKLKKEGV